MLDWLTRTVIRHLRICQGSIDMGAITGQVHDGKYDLAERPVGW